MKFKKNQIFYIFLLFGTFLSFFNFVSAETGEIDTSVLNQAKVCHNVACDDFGIINFELSSEPSIVIDSNNGITGKVWGN